MAGTGFMPVIQIVVKLIADIHHAIQEIPRIAHVIDCACAFGLIEICRIDAEER